MAGISMISDGLKGLTTQWEAKSRLAKVARMSAPGAGGLIQVLSAVCESIGDHSADGEHCSALSERSSMPSIIALMVVVSIVNFLCRPGIPQRAAERLRGQARA